MNTPSGLLDDVGEVSLVTSSHERSIVSRVNDHFTPPESDYKSKKFDFLSSIETPDGKLGDQKYFKDVQCFFDQQVEVLGAEESAFFENEPLKTDMKEQLQQFVKVVDQKVKQWDELLGGEEGLEFHPCMSDTWKENVKRAACYAFFVHFGAKRRSEDDYKNPNKPRDYAYHVLGATDNVFRKMRFFDEQTIIATLLHDTREDSHKGIAALLKTKEKISPEALNARTDADKRRYKDEIDSYKQAQSEIKCGLADNQDSIREKFTGGIMKFEEYLDQNCQKRFGNEGGNCQVSISELVSMVTKPDDSTRDEALHKVLYSVFFHDDGSARSTRAAFSRFRAVLIKMADRLDNIKSYAIGAKKNRENSERAKKIEDETIYIFLNIARKMGMTNIEDLFKDYFAFNDDKSVNARRKRAQARRSVRDKEGKDSTWKEFCDEFHDKIRDEYRIKGEILKPGIHYTLEFRPWGHRFEDPERLAREVRIDRYQKQCRGVVIFHPNEAACERDGIQQESVQGAALRILPQMLPNTFSPDSGDLTIDFSSLKQSRFYRTIFGEISDQGPRGFKLGFSNKYGNAVNVVYSSQKAAECDLMGGYHYNFFRAANSDSEMVDDEVPKYFSDMAEEFRGGLPIFEKNYQLLRLFKLGLEPTVSLKKVRGGISSSVREVLAGLVSQGARLHLGDELGKDLADAFGRDEENREAAYKLLQELVAKTLLLIGNGGEEVKFEYETGRRIPRRINLPLQAGCSKEDLARLAFVIFVPVLAGRKFKVKELENFSLRPSVRSLRRRLNALWPGETLYLSYMRREFEIIITEDELSVDSIKELIEFAEKVLERQKSDLLDEPNLNAA